MQSPSPAPNGPCVTQAGLTQRCLYWPSPFLGPWPKDGIHTYVCSPSSRGSATLYSPMSFPPLQSRIPSTQQDGLPVLLRAFLSETQGPRCAFSCGVCPSPLGPPRPALTVMIPPPPETPLSSSTRAVGEAGMSSDSVPVFTGACETPHS